MHSAISALPPPLAQSLLTVAQEHVQFSQCLLIAVSVCLAVTVSLLGSLCVAVDMRMSFCGAVCVWRSVCS